MSLSIWPKKLNYFFLCKRGVFLIGAIWLVVACVFWPWPQSAFVFASFLSLFLFLADPFYFLLFLLAFFPVYSGLGQSWQIDFASFSFNADGLLKMAYALLFGFLFFMRGQRIKKSFLGGFFLFFLFISLFRLYPNFFQAGISIVVSFVLYLGVYLLVLDEVKTPAKERKVWQACILGVFLNLAVFGLQLVEIGTGDILALKSGATGFFSHAGAIADYLLVLLPLWVLYPSAWGGAGVFFSTAAIFLSFIRACWAGLVAFFVAAGLFFKNRMIWVVFLVFIAGLFFYAPAREYLPVLNKEQAVVGSFQARVKMWQELFGTMKKGDWLFGKGSGYSVSHIANNPLFGESKYFAPHGSWAEAIVDWGIVGGIVMLFLLLKIVHLFFASHSPWVRLVAANSFSFLIIKGALASLFSLTEVLIYFFVVLALAELRLNKNNEAKTDFFMGS